jgi:hypothetical protein
MTPAEVVVDVFGGHRRAARVLDIAGSAVRRVRKPGGSVPIEYSRALLDAVAAQERHLTLHEPVFGRPGLTRRIHLMDGTSAPRSRTIGALGAMARALTRESRG